MPLRTVIDFASAEDLAAWATTEPDRQRALRLRTAVRALFAEAVGAPEGTLPRSNALAELNATAALLEPAQLAWPADAAPHRRAPADPFGALLGALATEAINLLAGPDRDRLRACQAPRCVRFFLKHRPRQEWCRPACGNRARVARFHDRRRYGRNTNTPQPT